MGAKTPPIRAAFFEAMLELPRGNSNLPPVSVALKFMRTTREWANWVADVARGLGSVGQTLSTTAALNFPSVAAGGAEDLTVVLEGVRANDSAPVVTIGVPSGVNAGLVFHGFVSADDEVTVRATNVTGAPINPVEHTFRVEVRRYA